VFVAGAVCGLLLASLVLPLAARFIHGLSMPGIVVATGLTLGVLVALVSASIPAAFAARLRVATALAGHRAA